MACVALTTRTFEPGTAKPGTRSPSALRKPGLGAYFRVIDPEQLQRREPVPAVEDVERERSLAAARLLGVVLENDDRLLKPVGVDVVGQIADLLAAHHRQHLGHRVYREPPPTAAYRN
jgi:hypothetical protein